MAAPRGETLSQHFTGFFKEYALLKELYVEIARTSARVFIQHHLGLKDQVARTGFSRQGSFSLALSPSVNTANFSATMLPWGCTFFRRQSHRKVCPRMHAHSRARKYSLMSCQPRRSRGGWSGWPPFCGDFYQPGVRLFRCFCEHLGERNLSLPLSRSTATSLIATQRVSPTPQWASYTPQSPIRA